MKHLLALMATLAVLTLSGCAQPPQLAPLMAMPAVPADKVDLLDVELKFNSDSDLEENTVQLKTHIVKPNSSVVINVPSGLFEDQSDATASSQDFKTKDFFNEAEQQIERVLIKNGFRVLSRSKFEAKLRKLRDEARCDPNQFRCLVSQVSPEVRPILEDLKAQFDAGKISASEYAEQIKSFKDKLQTSSAGKRRNGKEKELTDISEVMRAAESGNVQSDYVLQINMFDTAQKITVTTDLRYQPEVRKFIRDHQGIKKQFNNGKNLIQCHVIGAKLNAKLVHVRTGEIAWIGEHQLNEFSSGVQNVSIEMGNKTYASNVADIQRFVNEQNTSRARQSRFGRDVTIPEFKFKNQLLEPTVSAGKCEPTWKVDKRTQIKLAKTVAKELMSTINVSEEPATAPAPKVVDESSIEDKVEKAG